MSNADIEVLPGWNKADTLYLAECLEGRHGAGARVSEVDRAARFVRAAIAVADGRKAGTQDGRNATLTRVLAAIPVAPGGAGPDDKAFVLSPDEQRMVLKQRAHAQRNAGDPEEQVG